MAKLVKLAIKPSEEPAGTSIRCSLAIVGTFLTQQYSVIPTMCGKEDFFSNHPLSFFPPTAKCSLHRVEKDASAPCNFNQTWDQQGGKKQRCNNFGNLCLMLGYR